MANANVPFSGLPIAGALTGTEVLPVDQGGTTVQTTIASIANMVSSGLHSVGNPTALVGLTAVNGSTITAMRRDGAPALDQSISPVWTGTHTFSTAVVLSSAITLASTYSIPVGGAVGVGYKLSASSNYGVFFGSGAPTLTAAQGSLYLRSDGQPYYNTAGSTLWRNVGGLVLLNTLVASNSVSLSDTTSFSSVFDDYIIVYSNMLPTSVSTDLTLLVHSAGTFQNSGYNNLTNASATSSYASVTQSSGTSIGIASSLGGASGEIMFHNVNGSIGKQMAGRNSLYVAASSVLTQINMGCTWISSLVVDGFQMLFTSAGGNIVSGTVRIYGLVK